MIKLTATLLDTVTKKTATDSHKYDDIDHLKFMWSEHNWSCDCNRADEDTFPEVEKELESKYGEGICFGSNRIVVVDVSVEPDISASEKRKLLLDMNAQYEDSVIETANEIYSSIKKEG